MIRFCVLMLCIALMPGLTLAQDRMSPVISQRILRIMERTEDDTTSTLRELGALSQRNNVSAADRAFVVREIAAILVRENRQQEALQMLSEELAEKPSGFVPSVRLFFGQLLLMEGESTRALQQLQQWRSQIQNPHPLELSMLAYAYLQEEQWGAAAEVFEQVLEISETRNDQWLELLAYAHTRNGESEKAVTLLESVIQENPWQARWWNQLSNIYLLLENYQSGTAGLSISSYTQELDYGESRRLAGLLSMLELPAQAAESLESAIARYPEQANYEDLMLAGELWMLAREHDSAIVTFQAAMELATDGEPALKIAQMHLQWERYPEALAALQLAQEAFGEKTPEQVYYLMAIVEINLGDLDAASLTVGRLDSEGEYAERAANLESYIENLRESK